MVINIDHLLAADVLDSKEFPSKLTSSKRLPKPKNKLYNVRFGNQVFFCFGRRLFVLCEFFLPFSFPLLYFICGIKCDEMEWVFDACFGFHILIYTSISICHIGFENVTGDTLQFIRLDRRQMGTFLCIGMSHSLLTQLGIT